jgi:hypothetical protein
VKYMLHDNQGTLEDLDNFDVLEFEESFRWKLSWYIDKTNPTKSNSMPISHVA